MVRIQTASLWESVSPSLPLSFSLPFLPSYRPLFPPSPVGERGPLPPHPSPAAGSAPARRWGRRRHLADAGEGAASRPWKQCIFYEALPTAWKSYINAALISLAIVGTLAGPPRG